MTVAHLDLRWSMFDGRCSIKSHNNFIIYLIKFLFLSSSFYSVHYNNACSVFIFFYLALCFNFSVETIILQLTTDKLTIGKPSKAVLGNPQVGLVDLNTESAILIFCELKDCGYPNKGQNGCVYVNWILNPHFLRIYELRIPQRSSLICKLFANRKCEFPSQR